MKGSEKRESGEDDPPSCFQNLTENHQSLLRLIRQINSKSLIKEFVSRDSLETCTIMRKDPRLVSKAPPLKAVPETKAGESEFDSTLAASPSPSVTESVKGRPSSGFDALSNYAVGHRLGQGVNSTVWHAVHEPTLTEVALKTYKNYEEVRSRILREVNVLRYAKHPNIIRFLAKIDTPKYFHVVIEYVEGRTLSRYLRSKIGLRLPEGEANAVFKQILSAIVYCHKHNICHRDLKLDNILITNNHEVKIVDFGFATCRPATLRSTVFCGTPHYMAPEILAGEGYTGPPVDIWALGVVLYFMLVGKYPFDGLTESEIFARVRRGKYTTPSALSSKAKEVLSRMLEPNPARRATARDLVSHKWLCSTFLDWYEPSNA